MSDNRDERTGRFTHDPTWERPLAETWPEPRTRAPMPAHQRKHPDLLTFRLPPMWREKLDFIAESQHKTVRQVVIECIAAVVAPVISEQKALRDSAPRMPSTVGQNRKVERVADMHPSTVHSAVPEFDHVEKWRAKEGKKETRFRGGLVDKPRR